MLLCCESESSSGGEALFVDGRALYHTLRASHPSLLLAMQQAKAMVFRNADGCLCAPIFNRTIITSSLPSYRAAAAATATATATSLPPIDNGDDGSGMCRMTLRFRNDTNGFPSCTLARHWATLCDIIDQHTITLPLSLAQGYILDNTWYHCNHT